MTGSPRGALVLGTLLVALSIIAVALTLHIYGQLDEAAGVMRALVVAQQQIDDTIRIQLDEETGLRGYLATGQRFFLEPYTESGDQFQIELASFGRTTHALGIPQLEASIADMSRLHDSWQRDVARPLLAHPRSSGALSRETLGKALVDQLRSDNNRVHGLLRERLDQAQADLKDRINQALIGGLISVAIFGTLGMVFVASRAHLLERIARDRAIVETLEGAFRTDLDALPGSRVGTAYLSADKDAAVGGDLYDIRKLDDARGLVLVADVSGKGIGAAVNTAFVKYSIRTLALSHDDPAAILTAFNRMFLETIKDPGIFVVVFVGILDCRNHSFTYASAGHGGAFLRRASEVTQLEVTGPIVGVEAGVAYAARVLQLSGGDLLMLATDGLTEARDVRGNMLADSGAMALLRDAPLEPQACADELVREVRHLSGGALTDDLALLVIAIDPAILPAAVGASAAS